METHVKVLGALQIALGSLSLLAAVILTVVFMGGVGAMGISGDPDAQRAMPFVGLMFCPEPVRAASEVRRVLKPGARFALAVWDVPERNPFFTSIASVVAQFVPAPPPDPAAPGAFRLAPPGELERVLRSAGFSDISIEPRPMRLTYDSLEDYWRIQTDLAAPLRAALASMTPDRVEALKTQVFAALRPHMQGDAVTLAAVPLCASARRSE